MPCNHKFKKYLHLDHIDFEPETLVVGTFIPEWPESDSTEWFFGRTLDVKGNRNLLFWDVVPRIYNETSLIDAGAGEWKSFCKRNKIAITDIISSIDDAEEENAAHHKILANYVDEALVFHFDDFDFVNIVGLLKRHPSIRNIYLTRGITESFWRHLWYPVIQYCNTHGIHERQLLTPSVGAQYQHEAYNHDNPGSQIALLEDYILMRWKNEWHF